MMINDQLHKKYQKEHLTPSFEGKLIVRLLSFFRPYRISLTWAVFFLFVAKLIEVLVPIYIGYTVQLIIQNVKADVPLKEAILSRIVTSSLAVTGLLLLSFLFEAFSIFLKSWAGQKTLYSVRTQVFRHIQLLPMAYFDRNAIGRLMTRTVHDVEQINQMFSESLVPLLGNLLLFLGIYIGILAIDWKIGLAFGILLPLVWWLTNTFRNNQKTSYELMRNIISHMNAFIQEHLMGVSTIRSFGLQQQEKKQFDEINQDHFKASIETVHHFSFFIAAIDFLQSAAMICAFVVLAASALPSSEFAAGTFFAFSLYSMMFFRPLADLAERYNVLQAAVVAADRIFEVLNQKTEEQLHLKVAPQLFLQEIEHVEFKDVWFAYEGENWILKGLSFELKKGESVAVVGVTGAGKTTLMNLLLRFYEFQKGSIQINGIDIRQYSLNALRAEFSVVQQDPAIFSGTLAENVGLYQENSPLFSLDVLENYVNLQPLVKRLPGGWQHQLSERGKSLSAGEMQLISLARAVAHKHSFLVLNEATANIDTSTERMIQDVLQRVLKNKTSLIIAHRLSTIKDAGRILVLHEGVLAESGTHQQLLDRKGLYEKLYRLQFADPAH